MLGTEVVEGYMLGTEVVINNPLCSQVQTAVDFLDDGVLTTHFSSCSVLSGAWDKFNHWSVTAACPSHHHRVVEVDFQEQLL